MKKKLGVPDGNMFMDMLRDTDINLIAICRDYSERYRITHSLDAFLALWEIINGEFYHAHIRKGSPKYSEEAQEALQEFMAFIYQTMEDHAINLDRALD